MTQRITIAAAAVVWALVLATSPVNAQQGPLPVTVANPLAKTIKQWDEYSGRFKAVQMVDLKARVSGFVEIVHFQDGQLVKAGDLLFSLDKRPFELAVDSAQAEITRIQAQVALAKADVDRAAPLARSRTISEQVFQQRQAALSVARAQLVGAEVALKSAELNLGWADVRAPINGRISDRKVNVGNLISGGAGPNTTTLATIVSQSPIQFEFDVSERDFLRYSRLYLSGDRASSREVSNPVRIKLADEDEFTHEGQMDFVDNTLNARSGTLRGRAILPNTDQLLQPGLFGRLQLFGGDVDALLIPDSAVVSDQARKIVFVVDDTNTVQAVPVELGRLNGGLRVVKSGLKPTHQVVIKGLANPAVRPGAKVKPQAEKITMAN